MIKSPYSESLKFDLPGREHFGTTHFPSQYEAKKRDAWEMCVCNNTSLLLSLDTFMNGQRLFLLGGKLWLLELKPQPKKILEIIYQHFCCEYTKVCFYKLFFFSRTFIMLSLWLKCISFMWIWLHHTLLPLLQLFGKIQLFSNTQRALKEILLDLAPQPTPKNNNNLKLIHFRKKTSLKID